MHVACVIVWMMHKEEMCFCQFYQYPFGLYTIMSYMHVVRERWLVSISMHSVPFTVIICFHIPFGLSEHYTMGFIFSMHTEYGCSEAGAN